MTGTESEPKISNVKVRFIQDADSCPFSTSQRRNPHIQRRARKKTRISRK